MPIYEYYCHTCRKPISIYYSSIAQAAARPPVCGDCAGEHLTRLISNVAARSSGGAAAPGAGPAASAGGEHPQALAQAMRAAGAGRDMGNDFREVAGRLEKGESAASVEASLRRRVGEDMQAH
jgi:putative FmdB family regulatory protein